MNDTDKKDVPDYVIMCIARWLLPLIRSYYNSNRDKDSTIDEDKKVRSSREA